MRRLLDVGCGSATLFVDHAAHVRHVAGIDASELQLEIARRRLADRITDGTAELVQGEAGHLPWEDGRFSVVTSINAPKFFPDPLAALREMKRKGHPTLALCNVVGSTIAQESDGGDHRQCFAATFRHFAGKPLQIFWWWVVRPHRAL